HFQFWQQLIDKGIHFITRVKVNAAIEYQKVFTNGYTLRDRLIKIGSGTKKTPIVTLRLIEVRGGKIWHSYLTSVLDPEVLPPYVVIDLYEKRWRIELAFNIVKRLLGLSYLYKKLIVAPFPDKQRGSDQFFYQYSPKSPLTTYLQA
ncbi:MAG: transposase, partial [Microcystaceae cyanobacterium]